jgi:hypothetical protein
MCDENLLAGMKMFRKTLTFCKTSHKILDINVSTALKATLPREASSPWTANLPRKAISLQKGKFAAGGKLAKEGDFTTKSVLAKEGEFAEDYEFA